MSDAEMFKVKPNPKDPAVQARVMAIKRRMINDLAMHLPDDWLQNANAKNRNQFKIHMATSKTIQQILDIVSWTMVSIEKEEEAQRAGSEE